LKRTGVPLNSLRAFEAAGRHMSFTVAAEELSVTQVAVSRQVRVLEDYLEVPLFERGHRSVCLTEDGKRLLTVVSRAIEDVDSVISSISMRGRRDVLALQAYTAFAQKWLIPRLSDFHQRYPKIEVRLTASLQPVNFERQNIHAAIRSGNGTFEDCYSALIVPIELQPVCSPRLLKAGTLKGPEDLAKQTLLHSLARRNDWSDWLRSTGVKSVDADHGIKFENSAMSYEAAVQGIGVAMGMRVLVETYLRSGELVAPFDHVLTLNDGYYLIWPRNRQETPALRTFRAWLSEYSRSAN